MGDRGARIGARRSLGERIMTEREAEPAMDNVEGIGLTFDLRTEAFRWTGPFDRYQATYGLHPCPVCAPGDAGNPSQI